MSQSVDDLLQKLERDLPRLRKDLNSFPAVFEERACQIYELEDTERVQERLLQMLKDAGLS